MVRNSRGCGVNNKTPEPTGINKSTNSIEEDVYNFIKREKA
jgi:hypothetical protein